MEGHPLVWRKSFLLSSCLPRKKSLFCLFFLNYQAVKMQDSKGMKNVQCPLQLVLLTMLQWTATMPHSCYLKM